MNTESIKPGLMVHAKGQGKMQGAEGQHVGTVDHIDGERYIKLKKADARDGRHHWIPLDWVETVDNKAVYLKKTEEEFRAEKFDSFPGESEAESEGQEQNEQKRAI